MNFTEVVTAVRAMWSEVTDKQFLYDTTGPAELQLVIQEALNELNTELKFLRDRTTINGSSYITSCGSGPEWGSNPFMYELPSTFHALDKLGGILQNGIRRLEGSEPNYYKYQESYVAPTDVDHTVSTDDFYTAEFTGLIFHYFTKWVIKSEIDNGRSGYLCYFDPQLRLSDSVDVWFISTHPDPTTTIYLPGQFKMLLVYKACELLAPKFINAGRASAQMALYFTNLVERRMIEAKDHFGQKSSPTRILGPKDMNMYNSACRRIRAGRYVDRTGE